MPDSMTQILSSGPAGTKVNIAVLGDGFAAGADQTAYNNKVNDLLLNGLFKHDYYFEDIQAFNIYRVNLISVDSGVGTKTYNNGTLLNTVTKTRRSGTITTAPGRTAGSKAAPTPGLWSADWIGGWHLGTVDHFEPCNYQGGGGRRDLFVHNQDWFGLLRSATPWTLDKIYYRWIHNYRYGNNF